MNPYILKVKIRKLDAAMARAFTEAVQKLPGIERVDVNAEKGLARVVASREVALPELRRCGGGFPVEAFAADAPRAPSSPVMKLNIDGMTCRSCEITIERQLKKVPGVRKVDADATRGTVRVVVDEGRAPSLEELQRSIKDPKYRIHGSASSKHGAAVLADHKRPSMLQLVGLFALVLLLGMIFSKTGLLKPQTAIGTSVSFAAAFFIGLVAASSSCIAVSGGLLLGVTAKFRERYGSLTPLGRMRPVFLFVAGRLVSYGVLGGIIGAIGNALSPSPFITGVITLVAAFFMLVMGLDMLHLAPGWLKRLLPRMSKALAHRVMEGENKTHPAAPFLLGAGTFFLPCGFTQALQLYALTTGSVWGGASVLFAFALGTAPALLALGWASGSLKGAFGRFFFRFSGALVIVLGLWNIQNGLTIAGYPLALPRFSLPERAIAAPVDDSGSAFVRNEGGVQVVPIDVSYNGYWPDRFTLRRGVPARLEIGGDTAGRGCLAAFQIPKLGIRQLLQSGRTTSIAFTPEATGTYLFSCSMGMFRGQFTVI